MLILTRKENERIVIGDDIEVVVTRVSGNKVRIGIDAPRHVLVYRKEIAPLFCPECQQVGVKRHSLCSA